MMRTLAAIARNDLRVFLRNKTSWIWLFLTPLAFVYFMGFAVRGPGDPSNRRPPVLVENLDTNFLGRLFVDTLTAQGLWVLDATNRAQAERGVRIPADFTDRVLRLEPVKVEFFQLEGSNAGDAALIELRVVRALVAVNSHLVELAGRGVSGGAVTESALREVMQRPDPVRLDARFAGRRPVPSGFNFSLPGNLVMYLMMNLLIFGGTNLASDRASGVLRRFAVHPVRAGELIGGKIAGLVLLGAVQIAFFLFVGRLLFGVNLGANLPAVALTLLVFSWVAGSLGVLVGSLLRAEDRVVGVCVLASIAMGAIGGCWWPLEIAPPLLQTLAHGLPTGWALDALHQLISFGSGFAAVLKPLAVLTGFGLAANFLAARFFRGA